MTPVVTPTLSLRLLRCPSKPWLSFMSATSDTTHGLSSPLHRCSVTCSTCHPPSVHPSDLSSRVPAQHNTSSSYSTLKHASCRVWSCRVRMRCTSGRKKIKNKIKRNFGGQGVTEFVGIGPGFKMFGCKGCWRRRGWVGGWLRGCRIV